MRIIQKNTDPPPKERTVYCPHCTSELAVTDADLKAVGDHHEATCPVCHKPFRCMTDTELTQAYYAK